MTVAAWERGGRMGNHWMRMRSLGQTIPGIYYPARGTVLSFPVHVARSVGYTYVAVPMESLAQAIFSFLYNGLISTHKAWHKQHYPNEYEYVAVDWCCYNFSLNINDSWPLMNLRISSWFHRRGMNMYLSLRQYISTAPRRFNICSRDICTVHMYEAHRAGTNLRGALL